MRAWLMYHDRDFDRAQEPPWNGTALTRDLALDTLLAAMAGRDALVFEMAQKGLLLGSGNPPDTIRYRQAVLRDCLQNAPVVTAIYALADEAIISRKKHWWWSLSSHYPDSILHGAVDLLQTLVGLLRRLREIGRAETGRVESQGFTRLFTSLDQELSDDYLASIQAHLGELKFRQGVLMSARLGDRNEGTNYVLRQPDGPGPGLLDRLLGRGPAAYTFRIDERDEAGARALAALRGRGINDVANALAQAADHVLSFFDSLRAELAFYLGGVHLHDRLVERGLPTVFPALAPAGRRQYECRALYDVSLALSLDRQIVGNDLDASGRDLLVVTGANQGGKSSFLRSVGLAQLMLQCGLFVGAAAFTGEPCPAVVTHCRREEDRTMTSGKLDEELARISEIADHVVPGALVLFNESFAATNEREGSEIAKQTVRALLNKGIRIVYVTHLYAFAHEMFATGGDAVLCLRAERLADGTRTFRMVEGKPLETSYGEDLYREVFGAGPEERDAAMASSSASTDDGADVQADRAGPRG